MRAPAIASWGLLQWRPAAGWIPANLGWVLLQVYQLSIGAVCGLSWPSDRLVVQVLDDSTDEVIKVELKLTPEPDSS